MAEPLTAEEIDRQQLLALGVVNFSEDANTTQAKCARLSLRWHATVEQRDKQIERLQYWEKQHIACTTVLQERVAELETALDEMHAEYGHIPRAAPIYCGILPPDDAREGVK